MYWSKRAAGPALKYDKGDEWLKIKGTHTPEEILQEICGLKTSDFLYNEILKTYQKI